MTQQVVVVVAAARVVAGKVEGEDAADAVGEAEEGVVEGVDGVVKEAVVIERMTICLLIVSPCLVHLDHLRRQFARDSQPLQHQ